MTSKGKSKHTVEFHIPKVYKTSEDPPRRFIYINRRKKYLDLPEGITDAEVLAHVKETYSIKRVPKKRKTKKVQKKKKQSRKRGTRIMNKAVAIVNSGPAVPQQPYILPNRLDPDIQNVVNQLRSMNNAVPRIDRALADLEHLARNPPAAAPPAPPGPPPGPAVPRAVIVDGRVIPAEVSEPASVGARSGSRIVTLTDIHPAAAAYRGPGPGRKDLAYSEETNLASGTNNDRPAMVSAMAARERDAVHKAKHLQDQLKSNQRKYADHLTVVTKRSEEAANEATRLREGLENQLKRAMDKYSAIQQEANKFEVWIKEVDDGNRNFTAIVTEKRLPHPDKANMRITLQSSKNDAARALYKAEPEHPSIVQAIRQAERRRGAQDLEEHIKDLENQLRDVIEQNARGEGENIYGSGLWTNQILEVMAKVPGFIGCVPSDQFGKLLEYIKPHSKVGWIANLDDSKGPGTHWVAFVANGTDQGPDAHSLMYFDPFGEDVPNNMLQGLKDIADKIDPDNMMKLKVSRVQHQPKKYGDGSPTETCGFHSMKFLLDMLARNQSFAEATGYHERITDQSGKYEKEIERLQKMPPFNYVQMSGEGASLVRTQFPPKVRTFLAKHGEENIQSIQVCRKPIFSFIQKTINLLRRVTLQEQNPEYDKLFHLYLLIKLKQSGEEIKIERNQVFNLTNISQADRNPEDGECRNVRNPSITFGAMLEKASAGDGSWFRYSPTENNCQDACIDLLRAGGVLTSELQTFIKQDVSKLLPKFIADAGQAVTDVAHGVDKAIEGDGCACENKN